jgi:predicted DCC family thiol-disulfide oxidoreductase YuxK
MTVREQSLENPVVLFDGVCNLCNGAVQFIIKHDKKGLFRFAPLQQLENLQTDKAIQEERQTLSSVLLVEKGILYKESTAILRIAKQLQFPVNLVYAFTIFPAFLRDPIYRWIAKNRYRWFGKKDQCMLPTAALKARFL